MSKSPKDGPSKRLMRKYRIGITGSDSYLLTGRARAYLYRPYMWGSDLVVFANHRSRVGMRGGHVLAQDRVCVDMEHGYVEALGRSRVRMASGYCGAFGRSSITVYGGYCSAKGRSSVVQYGGRVDTLEDARILECSPREAQP